MTTKATICLNMIVKDETPVIARCLDSLKGLIDHWVIVDTGSTDGTQDLVRRLLADVPGELIERPWVDFGHNRSEAIEAARGKGDYLLFIDADEFVRPGSSLPERLDKDSYMVRMLSGEVSYFKVQLVNNRLPWRFVGVLHEFPACPEPHSEGVLEGLTIIRATGGARSRDPLTYRKDALVLERALLDDPDNPRTTFYLAQSYRDAGDHELALRHYRRRIALGGWDEEVWYSQLQAALVCDRMGRPWPDILAEYMRAYELRPARAEPLFHVACHYLAERRFTLANLFLARAAALPAPAEDRLFVEQALYDYRIAVEYAVSAYWAGDDSEAIRVNNELLAGSRLPPDLFEQVVANRRFSLDRLIPGGRGGEAPPVVVLVPFRDAGGALDNCVETLLQQTADEFRMIFVDDGSGDGSAEGVPVDDPRIALIRRESPEGFARAVLGPVRDLAPDTVLVALDGAEWLSGPGSIAAVAATFADRACEAFYSQYRLTDGSYGEAMPYWNAASFEARDLKACRPGLMAWRAKLTAGLGPDDFARGDGLERLFDRALGAAGFLGTAFCDEPLCIRDGRRSTEAPAATA